MSLEDYKVKNLFLVMGTNPLPNYIAAKLLTKPNANIYFIHSADISELCNNLEALLIDDGFAKPGRIQVDESNGDDIHEKILAEVKNKGLNEIGVNYTGGTKAMAVHSYQALKEIDSKATFFYLDPRKMVFRVEKDGTFRKSDCLRDLIQINIFQMLKLHGYEIIHDNDPMYSSPQFSDLAEYMGKNLNIKKYRDWCSANLRGVDPDNKKRGNQLISKFKVNEKNDATGREIKLDNATIAPNSSEKPWLGCGTIGDLAARCKTTPKILIRYLDGLWLEDYVLFCLNDISKKVETTVTACRNLSAAKAITNRAGAPLTKKDGNSIVRTFQLDDFALIGYQLFGISCGTTYDKNELKLKLFEAMLRSTQIGGDEARFALVCGHSDPLTIESEVNNVWDTKGNLKVFGADDLPDLTKRLLDWFNDQPGGAL